MRDENHYDKLRARTDKERVELISKWSSWFYDQTETFEGKIGMQLAYLWAAIAKAQMIEAESDSPVVQLLQASKDADEDPIWDYIDVMDPETYESVEFCPHGERFDSSDPCPDWDKESKEP